MERVGAFRAKVVVEAARQVLSGSIFENRRLVSNRYEPAESIVPYA